MLLEWSVFQDALWNGMFANMLLKISCRHGGWNASEDKDEASVTRKENRRMHLATAWNGCCQRQAMKRNCSFKSRDSSQPWWGLRGNNVEGVESYRRKMAKAPSSQRLDDQIFKEKIQPSRNRSGESSNQKITRKLAEKPLWYHDRGW